MAVINGTTGADDLAGTGQADLIRSDSGPDTIAAGKGNDSVHGGGGHDVVKGAKGDDVLYGFSDADVAANSGAIALTKVGEGFALPVFATSAPGAPNHLFVVEKDTADVRILNLTNGQIADDPFLNIDQSTISTGGEQGLLGFAFAPDYADSGNVYVYLTNGNGDIEIREYTRSETNPDEVDPASMRVVLPIAHPRGQPQRRLDRLRPRRDASTSRRATAAAATTRQQRPEPQHPARQDAAHRRRRRRLPGNAPATTPSRRRNPFAGGGARGRRDLALRPAQPVARRFDRATGDMWIGDVGQNAVGGDRLRRRRAPAG